MFDHEIRATGSEASQASKWVFYHYDPSKVAAIIFVVLFFITTGLHLFQLLRSRTWYFVPMVIGGFCKFFLRMLYSRLRQAKIELGLIYTRYNI